MKCLRCGGEIHRNDRLCRSCGSDAAVMIKLKGMSDKYYNRAIDLIKFSNLTAALYCLKRSIACNKKNINARNLIGLVYLETGETGEAFKHWLLSASYKKTDNKALEYMEYSKENIVEFDKMDMGVKMYNEALAMLKTVNIKSDDTEKIRRYIDTVINKLKGALDFNPRLLKAVNLMTLCYIIIGERSKALELTKSVLYTDTANPQASLHYNILCPDRTRPPIKITGNIEQKKKTTEVQPPPMEEQGPFTSMMFMEAAAFLIGVLACAAVFVFLIIPGIRQSGGAGSSGSGEAAVSGSAVSETGSEGASSGNLSADIAAREADIKRAKELYDAFYYIDACGLIFGMDTRGISSESLEIYNSIIYNVTLNGANGLVDLGRKSYNEGDGESAEIFFNKALTYSDEAGDDEELLKTKYTALFYLGRIAMDRQENDTARELFEQVKENHPDRRYQSYAEGYLNSL
ncbi:MAG: tetratricopeptide repeat protein [Clostridiales bacterium]|nr:tetratricopeptide repeat protein [Clostridiales bacterium]